MRTSATAPERSIDKRNVKEKPVPATMHIDGSAHSIAGAPTPIRASSRRGQGAGAGTRGRGPDRDGDARGPASQRTARGPKAGTRGRGSEEAPRAGGAERMKGLPQAQQHCDRVQLLGIKRRNASSVRPAIDTLKAPHHFWGRFATRAGSRS